MVDDWTAAGATASLVALAELGDKSQLVCMLLAVRQGAVKTVLGAILAFSVLNGLAVVVGATLGEWVPVQWVLLAASIAFFVFAGLTWRDGDDDESEEVTVDSRWGPILGTAALLGLAELGDKTQLTVAALAAVQPPFGTWLGGTLALTGTSLLASVVGQSLLERLPLRWVKKVASLLFLAMGVWSAWRAWVVFQGG